MARQTLGRGLSALLGEEKPGDPPAPAVPNEIDIDLIDANPEQPRTTFTEANLEELSLSIRANGVVQPIVLRPAGDRYQIVAGERRWRASQKAGLRKIPAVIRDVSDDKLLELALIENIQRQELNPIEEASAYRKLIDTLGLTQEAVAERVGKDRTVITTAMRLLRLPDDLRRRIENGQLSAGHGRALLMVEDPKQQRALAQAAIDNSWSVRELERHTKRPVSTLNVATTRVASTDPNVKAAETKLMRTLSTGVKIVPAKKGKGGKIEIEYYGTDDLDRLFQMLMKQ
jgi:ParB family transcriptional regulator, chromosome partitioning protein